MTFALRVALLLAISAAARAETTLRARRMAGPFASVEAACESATCAPVRLEGEEVPQTRSCVEDPVSHMDNPPAPFLAVRLYAINCRAPALRDADFGYRVLAHTSGGWWLSGPLFFAGGNDRYCSGEVSASWEAREVLPGGKREVVLHARAATECVACSKQGFERKGVDLIAVMTADVGPAIFPPIAAGQYFDQEAIDDAVPSTHCPTLHHHAVLGVTWSPGALTLAGMPVWLSMKRRVDGGWIIDQRRTAPSTAGRYRFVR